MSDPRTTAHGVLELHPKGYGFLRSPVRNYTPAPADAYVSGQLIDKFRLAEGVHLAGATGPPPVEVIASSSDKDTASHIRVAGLVVERAKRLTEMGRDTLVLLDSLTRLARAHNKTAGSGRTMSGGIDTKTMEVPKRL